MLQGEHSAILSTFNKLPFVIKICVLSIFEWPLRLGFTVCTNGLFFRFDTINLGWSIVYIEVTQIIIYK